MSNTKLTQEEACALLEMTKRALIDTIALPIYGEGKEFDVIGDTKKDLFTINIFHAKIRSNKYNIGARIKKNGIMLLELHVNPTNIHVNPNGEKLKGSHWHIYTEEFGRTFAFLAEDLEADNFVASTISFLIRFNVIERPEILEQFEVT